MAGSAEKLCILESVLLNIEEPIAKRTQAAFRLRTDGREASCRIIETALTNKLDCDLMRHELAYIIGQMQFQSSSPLLESILLDEDDSVLVRHECAEALGALGSVRSVNILTSLSSHPSVEIAETCQIALDLINWRQHQVDINAACSVNEKSLYLSVDPAPPMKESMSIDEMTAVLLDSETSNLFSRYRAMFSLRDLNSDAAALALVRGFQDSSALFRHEIAFVLGQMQRSVTVDGKALAFLHCCHYSLFS